MPKEKKVALIGIDATDTELHDIMAGMEYMAKKMDLTFVFINTSKIKTMPREEFRDMLREFDA